jgi:uncharacterized membrane protein YozB (DUF420 family)
MMQVPPQYAIFPQINATLNGTTAILLLIARNLIKHGRMAAHRAVMIAAVATSAVFLSCYLYYHYCLYYYAHSPSKHFAGQGWSRPVYFTILTSHTILAIIILPMVIITLSRGLRKRFDRHRTLDVSFVDSTCQ